MKSQRHVNTFYKGMVQDVDKLQMQAETYIYALNGRVIYNIDGTYAFENANGTLLALTISPNYGRPTAGTYVPIGGVQLNGYLVLFLANATTGNSEIGLVTQPSFGTFIYQTAFNDIYDPNQQKLNFSIQNPMRDFEVVSENSQTQNVYFNDYHNEPRVFNVVLGTVPYTSGGTTWFAPGHQYNPQPDAPITNASRYPAFYSVHAIAQMIDLTWGLCKFVKTISGELLTGSYQYVYRYISQNGYATGFSPVSGQMFVSLDTPGGDWTQYQMLNSNVQSTKGNLLEFDFLDTRFQQIEVAAIYWETDAAPTNAYTFWLGDIPANGTLQVEHQFTGEAIDISKILQQYTEISKAKTGGLKDNQRNLANYSVFPLLEIDTTKISVAPFGRNMLSDNTTLPVTIPLTGQAVTLNDTVTVNMADSLPVVYSLINDYISYKGVQWASIFRGHFGGEIYPYAIVVFDRKGQPFFAQHIADVTFPTRYGNAFTQNRLSGITTTAAGAPGDWLHTAQSPNRPVTDTQTTDNFVLNLLGLKFSGIDLTDILYDANGLLQVSGFSIVRTARIKQILAQGLVMSSGFTLNQDNGNNLANPCPTPFNAYLSWENQNSGQPYNGAGGNVAGIGGAMGPNYQGNQFWTNPGGLPILPGANPFTTAVGFDPIWKNRSTTSPDYNPSLGALFEHSIPTCSARQQLGIFECPDFMIDNAIVGAQSNEGDVLELCNVVTTAYNNNGAIFYNPNAGGNPLNADGTYNHALYTGNPLITDNTAFSQSIATQLMYPGQNGGHQSYYQKNYRSALTAPFNNFPPTLCPDQSNVFAAIGLPAYFGQTFLGQCISIGPTTNNPQNWFPNIQEGVQFNGLNNNVFYEQAVNVVDYDAWNNNGVGTPQQYRAYQREPIIAFQYSNGGAVRQGPFPQPINMLGVATDGGCGSAAYFLANYIRPIGAYQITEELLQNRTYLPTGHFVPVNASIIATIKAIPANNGRCIFNNVEVWGGDCFLDYWTYYRLYGEMAQTHGSNQDYSLGLSFPIESVFNISLRQGNTYESVGPLPAATFNGTDPSNPFPNGLYYQSATSEKLEQFNENVVLDASSTQTFAFAAKPAAFKPIYDFPVNEICTAVKVYGEQYDTFRLFPVDNFQSADGSKGQINSMQYIFDNLYIIQERAVARVRLNDRNQSTGSLGSSVLLASEVGYAGHDYISYVDGTTNQFSVINTGKALHFIDTEQGKHFRFAQDGILCMSDRFGMHNYFYARSRQYFNQDNPVGGTGILGAYDFKNSSVYYTFSKIQSTTTPLIPAETLEFDDSEAQYKGFHSFNPNIYFNYLGYLISPNPNAPTSLFIHDQGPKGLIYGTYFDTFLRFTVNPTQTEPQYFDNGRLALNTQAASTKINTATFFVQDMPIQQVVFGTNTKWKYRQGFLEYGMRGTIGANTPMRLRGKWCTVEFDIINDASNTVVRISNHGTKQRLSPRL